MAEKSESAAEGVAWMSGSDEDKSPRIRFDHWFFHKMEDIHFQLTGAEKEPTLMAKYTKNEVVLAFKGIMKEFNIDPGSADGQMLEQVAKGLKYVKGLRIGDPLPKEIITREASWALSPRHKEIAYQRVSLQLVNWLTGGDNMITDPDELLQLADDPLTKKQIAVAFGEAAEKLGYGKNEKEKVVQHVEELATELAYIEALRDRFRRIKVMDDKIQQLRRLYGREKSVLEIADQVARLGERAVKEFEKMFLEIDAQTGEILSVLKNLASQIPYIRDKRDDLHIRLMAWDDLLDRWTQAQVKMSQANLTLLRDTYKFLAPRFMVVKEWILMSKLQEGGVKGVRPSRPRAARQEDRRADALVRALALLLLLIGGSVFAKSPPIDYHEPPPDPPEMGNTPDRAPRPGPFQNLPAIDESQWVKLPPKKTPWWEFGKLDPVLSEACRLGDFASLPLNRIIQQFSGEKGQSLMQVVPAAYRHLLVDRRKLAKPGVTYYFYDTARPDCEVRVEAGVKVQSFPLGKGTALPPTDPNAVAKKKAEIASWPKN